MCTTNKSNEQKNCNSDIPTRKQWSELDAGLENIAPKRRVEYFEVKPILKSLGIGLRQVEVSEKPDFKFVYEGKKIGLEATRCYPPDALIHKNSKDQNKYEIGDKGVRSILEKYRKYKAERHEWVTLNIKFRNGLNYALRNPSLKRNEIEKIENEVIEEIETRLELGHYSTHTTDDKRMTELEYMGYKYTRTISWDEPQEGKVILAHGGEAIPGRTIEIEPLIKAISEKEIKLTEYRQLEKNKDVDEYWLCVNFPNSSERLLFDLEPFEIQSEYIRIYVTQFVYSQRIK